VGQGDRFPVPTLSSLSLWDAGTGIPYRGGINIPQDTKGTGQIKKACFRLPYR
jgi:hypothetical protein